MIIQFQGNLEGVFNMAVAVQPVGTDEQLTTISFGYEADTGSQIHIPLPACVKAITHQEAPEGFFFGLERSFSEDDSVGGNVFRHRLQDMRTIVTSPSLQLCQPRAKHSLVSFPLPVGTWKFPPICIQHATPKPGLLWLPVGRDCGTRYYITGLGKLRPKGRWQRSAYPLAIASRHEELGNFASLSEHGWRFLDDEPPGEIVELIPLGTRHAV